MVVRAILLSHASSAPYKARPALALSSGLDEMRATHHEVGNYFIVHALFVAPVSPSDIDAFVVYTGQTNGVGGVIGHDVRRISSIQAWQLVQQPPTPHVLSLREEGMIADDRFEHSLGPQISQSRTEFNSHSEPTSSRIFLPVSKNSRPERSDPYKSLARGKRD